MEQIHQITVSCLSKTWLFDIDGTILKHNGYKVGQEEILPGVKEFFAKNVKQEDYVILLTSRKLCFIEETKQFLLKNNIKFDIIVPNLPYGERILFNDKKNSGLVTAYSFNLDRDSGLENIKIEEVRDL